MDYALPSAWGQGSRGFWTKRKKTATSLFAILALIAGIAVAFKLFEQEVPNNVVRDASIFDFDVLVQRTPAQGCTQPAQGHSGFCDTSAGNPIFPNTEFVNGIEQPVSMFPGDTQEEIVRIVNTNRNPAKDASFEAYVTDLEVWRCSDFDGSGGTNNGDFDQETGECLGTDEQVGAGAEATRFTNFFSLQVIAERYFHEGTFDTDLAEDDESETCAGGLREITKQSPCDLGVIRASGSEALVDGAPTDERDYKFRVSELDDETDQSQFKGWYLKFTFVFQARVPAQPTSGAIIGTR